MKDIINRYLSFESEFERVTNELSDAVNSKYYDKIINCKTIVELDEIYNEIKDSIPNSFPLYMMFRLINKQKQKLTKNNSHG